ncbi:hypothetical protein ACKS0A_04520 [Histoplasma ohiense]
MMSSCAFRSLSLLSLLFSAPSDSAIIDTDVLCSIGGKLLSTKLVFSFSLSSGEKSVTGVVGSEPRGASMIKSSSDICSWLFFVDEPGRLGSGGLGTGREAFCGRSGNSGGGNGLRFGMEGLDKKPNLSGSGRGVPGGGSGCPRPIG